MGPGRASGGKRLRITWDNTLRVSVPCTALPVWPSLPFVKYIVLGIFPLNLHHNQVKVGILAIFLLMARKQSLGEVKK